MITSLAFGRVRRWVGVVAALALTSAPLAVVGLVSSAAPAGAASGSPVSVLEMCSCTGPLSSSTQQGVPTAQAWASWVNAHGGLNGHPVHLTVDDDTTSPAVATTQVEKAVAAHVAAIFDNSLVDVDWASVAAAANIPILGGFDNDIGYNNLDTFEPGGTLQYGDTGQELAIAHLTPYKTEAIVYCVENPSCASESDLDTKIGKEYGVKVTYLAGISFSAPNYTAECLAAKQTGAKVLEVGDAGAIQIKVAQNCATQDFNPIEVVASLNNGMPGLPQFKGMIASQSNIPYFVHDSVTKTFWAALDKYAPTLASSPNFGEPSIQIWAEGALLQSAVKAAGASSGTAITAAVIKKGLYHLPPGDNLGGLTPQVIHFTKGQYPNFSCWDYISVKNGKFVWANNEKPLCGYLTEPGKAEGSPFLKPKRTYNPGNQPSKPPSS
jgi:branched-chain amino acid transport system substrate-binding protein